MRWGRSLRQLLPHRPAAVVGMFLRRHVKFSGHADGAQVIVTQPAPDYRRPGHRRPSPQQGRQQVEPRFVGPQDASSFSYGLFFISPKRRSRHSLMASSSRWAVRRAGFCRLKPQPFRIRPTWEGSYETPNSLSMTWATRRRVQISPQNPEAEGPSSSNPGNRASCAAFSLDCPSWGLAAAQGLGSSVAGPADPLAHRPAGASQSLGHIGLFPAFLHPTPKPGAAGLPAIPSTAQRPSCSWA